MPKDLRAIVAKNDIPTVTEHGAALALAVERIWRPDAHLIGQQRATIIIGGHQRIGPLLGIVKVELAAVR